MKSIFLDKKFWNYYKKVHHHLGQLIRIEATGAISDKKKKRYLRLTPDKKRAYIERKIKKEMNDFLDNKIKNPVFEYYEDEKIDYAKIEQALDLAKNYFLGIKTTNSKQQIIKKWYLEKVQQDYRMVEIRKAARDNDSDRLCFYVKQAYAEPTDKIQTYAEKVLKNFLSNGVQSNGYRKKYTARHVRYYFKATLLAYGINDVKVKILKGRKTIVVRRIPNSDQVEIVLPTTTSANLKKLTKLIVHEVETHVIRKKSGEQQNSLLLLQKNCLPNYIETEEGLAVYNQQKLLGNKLQDPEDLSYILRALGVCWAKDHDFRSTFERVKKISAQVYKKAKDKNWESRSEKLAWGTCIRIFRGINKTEKPGNYNPLILRYLRGNIAVRNYLKKGGSINKLYIGKVGIEHLKDLAKLGITKAKIKPKYLARDMGRLTRIVAEHQKEWDNGSK